MGIVSEPPGIADVAPARLDRATLEANFVDLHPPLSVHEARVEADRCYFCYDAPCRRACPTSIDIPLFIRQIAAGNALGSARTILEANIMGGMCARVCPTETLCEEACVREAAEGKPVRIGLLQRHAVDAQMEAGKTPFTRAAPTGRRVGDRRRGAGGPRLRPRARRRRPRRHDLRGAGEVRRPQRIRHRRLQDAGRFRRAGKPPSFFRSAALRCNTAPSWAATVDLAELRRDFDAVFLGVGLGATNKLGLAGEGELANVIDAVDYIAELRQADDLGKLPVGRRVVVIGGGMTAVDVAVQSKRLGAETVTIVYRRGLEQMKASRFERDLAQTSGVLIRPWARPVALESHGGAASGVVFERTREDGGALVGAGGAFRIEADVVFSAIGQKGAIEALAAAGVKCSRDGRIVVDAERRTSLAGVWAGGDCVAGGLDLTVAAVEDGKQAARSIDAALKSKARG